VGGVRTDLDTTRDDLKMARSEMGTLIARNHDEIDQLRRLGEREYVEFTIAGKNKPQKVGNLTVELKGVNPEAQSIQRVMVVEDKRFEKKNRALNEPVFFYTSGTRLPEEMVINKVSKDQVSGYVSIPKRIRNRLPRQQRLPAVDSREKPTIAVGAGGKGGQLWLPAFLLRPGSSAKVRYNNSAARSPYLLQTPAILFAILMAFYRCAGKWRRDSMIHCRAGTCGHSQCLGHHAHAPANR